MATIHTFLTSGSVWPEPLDHLLHPVRLDQIEAWLADQAAERRPETQPSSVPHALWLGFTSPVDALDHACAPADAGTGGMPSPQSCLDQWLHQADLLLAARRAWPERCLLINLELLDAPSLRRFALRAGVEADGVAFQLPTNDRSLLDPRLVALVANQPVLLDRYRDLEGQADLFGRAPDFDPPWSNLAAAWFSDLCVRHWRHERQQFEFHTSAHAAAPDPAAELQVLALEGQLEALRQQEQQRTVELQELRTQLSAARTAPPQQVNAEEPGQRKALKRKLRQARAALLQLEQQQQSLGRQTSQQRDQLFEAQGDLERLFLADRDKASLCDAQARSMARAAGLIDRLASARRGSLGDVQPPNIQVLALLEGYRHSLKRAARLLGGGS
jgi:hypothetical protein